MISGSNVYNLTYDAENHMTGVSGAASNTYLYDGDGQRVKETTYENLAYGMPATSDTTLYWSVALTDNDLYANSGTGTSGEFAYTGSGLHYVQLDLGAVYSADKIKVWHYYNDGRTYHQNKTQVSADEVSWTTIFDSATSGEYAETSAGHTLTFTARSVRYVRDYLNGSTSNSGNHWIEIEVYGSRTVAHIGNYYDWDATASTPTKYYYAGAQRVAMRIGTGSGTTGLEWLIDDQLGSTAITADGATGARLSELRYKPWGELRYAYEATLTDRRYTGQQAEGIGLYDYGARWFDVQLGRFLQADTIVPNMGDPQAWDRYAYVDNNPVKFVDPSGHKLDQGGGSSSMGEDWWKKRQEKLEKNNTTIKSPNKTTDQGVANSLSYLALSFDATATVLSDVEVGVVDIVGGGAIVAGCIAGPEGCGAGVAFAAGIDVAVNLYAPIGTAENFLGVGSFTATSVADALNGNTSLTGNDSRVGIDTLVSARNMIAGFIPESNFDAAVSNSQFKYDMDRLVGNKTGGSISLFSNGKFNFGGIFTQMLKSNWW